jgi:hypothetical protein
MKKAEEIVCTLSLQERLARAKEWKGLIARYGGQAKMSDRGVTIEFKDIRDRSEVEQLVRKERECCRWMQLDLSDEDGALLLEIRADSDEGVAELVGSFCRETPVTPPE